MILWSEEHRLTVAVSCAQEFYETTDAGAFNATRDIEIWALCSARPASTSNSDFS